MTRLIRTLANSGRRLSNRRRVAAALILGISACSGGGGDSSSGSNASTAGDDARRVVLKDIGEQVILPALRDFDAKAAVLRIKVDALAGTPSNAAARSEAHQAWRDAMASWQRSEVLQVGPAGRSSGTDPTAGGANLRDLIYAFPLLQLCLIDQAAYAEQPVTTSSRVDTIGLGALEYLLFATGTNASCPPAQGVDPVARRAAHAKRIADQIASLATDLRTRWEPTGGNFLAQWSTAGAGSAVYAQPQAALNALSVALFYTEKETKDLKIANPIGVGATGLPSCDTASCPERLESRLSKHSGQNIRANLQALRDVFTGLNGGMGMNALLNGIQRQDISSKLIQQIDAALAHLNTVTPDFDTAVAAIPDRNTCVNSSANRSGNPACALNGFVKLVEDTFTTEVAGALSLARPDRAAGDND